VIDKVKEELEEFLRAVQQNASDEHIEEEFGDVLFSLINLARFLKVNPDTAFRKSESKIYKKINYIEEQLMAQNKTFEDVSLDEMERYWTEAKKLGM
jgi:tetrapyrrole methylase family protein/MazG family protein